MYVGNGIGPSFWGVSAVFCGGTLICAARVRARGVGAGGGVVERCLKKEGCFMREGGRNWSCERMRGRRVVERFIVEVKSSERADHYEGPSESAPAAASGRPSQQDMPCNSPSYIRSCSWTPLPLFEFDLNSHRSNAPTSPILS